MSNGSQIGGLIGAGIGLWVSGGNPQAGQLGYAIGPAVGGYVDPDVVLEPLVAADSGIAAEGIPQ